MSKAVAAAFGWLERAALYIGIGIVVFALYWNREQHKTPVIYAEFLEENYSGVKGEWTDLSVPFLITRPECRLSTETPRRVLIRAIMPSRDPLWINQIEPIDIRGPEEVFQRRAAFNLRFEMPIGMPVGPAEIWVESERICADPLFTWVTREVKTATPKYRISVQGAAGERQ